MRVRGTVYFWLPLGVLVASSNGCNIIGPSCLDRQKTGAVTSLSGEVAPGQVVSHLVPYDQNGSQNNVQVGWNLQGTIGGPRLGAYATSASCTEFTPPPGDNLEANQGACTVIAACGGTLAPDARACVAANTCRPTREDITCRSLIVTGPGNGAPPGFREYKLHIVGDPAHAAGYSIAITWFSGPDC